MLDMPYLYPGSRVSLGGLPVFRFCTGFFIKPVFFSITGKPVFTTYQKAQYIIVNCYAMVNIDCCDDIFYPRARCQIHLQTQPKAVKAI
jgi:hypothetical protein